MARKVPVRKSVIGHRAHVRRLGPEPANEADAALNEFMNEVENQQNETTVTWTSDGHPQKQVFDNRKDANYFARILEERGRNDVQVSLPKRREPLRAYAREFRAAGMPREANVASELAQEHGRIRRLMTSSRNPRLERAYGRSVFLDRQGRYHYRDNGEFVFSED